MIDFNKNTLTRRYTHADLVGVGALNRNTIDAQNKQVGFDPANHVHPIRRVRTFDAVTYYQGQGPIVVGLPACLREGRSRVCC